MPDDCGENMNPCFDVKIALSMIFQFRLVHTLFMLLFGAVLIAVLSMGSLFAWNLRHGFAEFLNAGDVDQLDRFTALVSRTIEPQPGFDAFLNGRLDMRALIAQFTAAQSRYSTPPIDLRPEGGPPPAPPGAEAIAERVAVFGIDQARLIGRPLPPDAEEGYIERPLLRGGQTVGRVRMLARKMPPDSVQSRFLRTQYIGIAAVSGVLTLLALGCAWWVSRLWARPLLAVKESSSRIAQGEFAFRHSESAEHELRTDEIGDVVRNVNQMAIELQMLDASRKRWIADVSHELRTPLSILKGEIEALKDGVRPISRSSFISLTEEVDHLSKLVSDLHLLALSNVQALPCQFDETNAIKMVEKVVDRFQTRSESLAISLNFVTNPLLDIHPENTASDEWLVVWDARRIEQLLINLIENSLRYTKSPGRIEITMKQRTEALELDIDDSAPGVIEADRAKLFEPLYRVDIARNRIANPLSSQQPGGGSGLGLSICQAIVRAHSGQITLSNSRLGGLRVHIKLPLVCGEKK
jgi:two-component system, OmpR family, sensor histidine kinase BaeS